MIIFFGILIVLVIIFSLINSIYRESKTSKSNANTDNLNGLNLNNTNQMVQVIFNTQCEIKLHSLNVKKGELIKLPCLHVDGKDFLGWSYLDNNKIIGPLKDNLVINKHTELVGVWENNDFIQRIKKLHIKTKLTGVTYNDRQMNISRLRPNQELIYEREKNNIYDQYAILVKNIYGKEIGYIPKEINKEIALNIDQGKNFNLNVIEIKGFEGSNLGVVISIREV